LRAGLPLRGLAPGIEPGLGPCRRPAGAGARPVSGWFQPEAEASEPVPSAPVSGQAPPPSPRLPIEANSDLPPSVSDRSELRSSTFRRPGRSKLRFLQPFGLDRGEPRSSAANGDRAEALIFTRSASPPEQAPRVRPGDARIGASPDPPSPARAGRSPLSPAGPEAGQAPPRSGSGRSEASSGPDPSAFASAGRFPLPLRRLQHLRPKPRTTAGRLPEIRPGIRLRLCWPGFFHRPASGKALVPFEGKKRLLSAASGRGSRPFPARLPSRPRK
jgi:hypothetical protein